MAIKKLSKEEWCAIKKRRDAGERVSALAKEYGIGVQTIRDKFSVQDHMIKNVSNQIIDAEIALKALPVIVQISVLEHVENLRAMSLHIGCVGKYQAMSAHELSRIAHAQIQKINVNDPLGSDESERALKSMAGIAKMTNDFGVIPIKLIEQNNKKPIDDDDDESLEKLLDKTVATRKT